MQIILPIIGLFLLGCITRQFIPEQTALVKWLNHFIVYLAMPALILLKVPAVILSNDMVIPAAIAWAWLLLGACSVVVISRTLSLPRTTEGAMLLLVTMGNTSVLGYPMVLAFFDDSVLAYAIFFDQLGGFLILSTFGLIVIAIYTPSNSEGMAKVSPRKIAKNVLTFPPFIALMVAILIPLDNITVWANGTLAVLGSLLMPTALFVLGVQFQPRLLDEHKVPLAAAVTLKMVVAPIFAWVVLAGLGSSGAMRTAAIFEAAMPSMITPGLMAIHAGIAPRFVTTLLGYSTVLAFVSLPFVAYLLSL